MLIFVKENFQSLQPNIQSWDMHCEGEPEEPEATQATQQTVATEATQADRVTQGPSASLLDSQQEPTPSTSKGGLRDKRSSPGASTSSKKLAKKDTKTTKCIPNPKRRRMSTRNSYSAESDLIEPPEFQITDFGSDKTTSPASD